MSNLDGKFLSQWEMSEAKRHEAKLNSIQKREKTHFLLSDIVVWGCGCCIGPNIDRYKPKLSPSEADDILKKRKKRVTR